MLRLTLPVIALAAALLSAPAGATGKNPGVYVSLEVRDAAACQRACADDGLCMAWALYANSCELTAIVPVIAPAGATAFALAQRAPAFAALRPAAQPAQSVATHAATPPPAPALHASEIAISAPVTAEPALQDDLVLLGGPEEGDLRQGSN
jgi:hypothetical protein